MSDCIFTDFEIKCDSCLFRYNFVIQYFIENNVKCQYIRIKFLTKLRMKL